MVETTRRSQAAQAEDLTEALDVEVANFVFWSQKNRKLRFQWPKP